MILNIEELALLKIIAEDHHRTKNVAKLIIAIDNCITFGDHLVISIWIADTIEEIKPDFMSMEEEAVFNKVDSYLAIDQ